MRTNQLLSTLLNCHYGERSLIKRIQTTNCNWQRNGLSLRSTDRPSKNLNMQLAQCGNVVSNSLLIKLQPSLCSSCKRFLDTDNGSAQVYDLVPPPPPTINFVHDHFISCKFIFIIFIIQGQVRLRPFLGRTLRLGQARGPSAAARAGLHF